MTKTISGRAYLQELHYDLGVRLQQNISGEDIYKFLKRRMKLLEHHPSWIIIDWSTAAKNHQPGLFGLFEFEAGWEGEDQLKIQGDFFLDTEDPYE
jgi:hypothetical protein